MADPVVEPLPMIREEDYDQCRGILKALPRTYAEWQEMRSDMRADLERPYKHDYSQIEIRDIPISPDVFAKRCKDWGGCNSSQEGQGGQASCGDCRGSSSTQGSGIVPQCDGEGTQCPEYPDFPRL